MVAELIKPEERTVILDRLYVPRPFRVRKKLVTSALIQGSRLALNDADEVAFFADEEDKLLNKCAPLAGFERKGTFRLIVMHH